MTSWRDLEIDSLEQLQAMPLNEDTADRIIDRLAELDSETIQRVVAGSRWSADQIEKLSNSNQRWNAALRNSTGQWIWFGLLQRDFNIAGSVDQMRNRTRGAAEHLARSFQTHVLGEMGGPAPAKQARRLYDALEAFTLRAFTLRPQRLPMAQQAKDEFPDVTLIALSDQLQQRETRDVSPEMYLEFISSPELHEYIYENGFMIIKPCYTGAPTYLYLLTDVVSYVLNPNLVSDAVLSQQYVRGPNMLRARRGELFTYYDTAKSTHPPMVIDGGGADWVAWPPVSSADRGDEQDGSGGEKLDIGGFAFDVQAVPGGQTPYLFWREERVGDDRTLRVFSVNGQPHANVIVPRSGSRPMSVEQVLALTERHAVLSVRDHSSKAVLVSLENDGILRPRFVADYEVEEPATGGILHEDDDTVVSFLLIPRDREMILRIYVHSATDVELQRETFVSWRHSTVVPQVIFTGRHLIVGTDDASKPLVLLFNEEWNGATALQYPGSFGVDRYGDFPIERNANSEAAAYVVDLARMRNHYQHVKCEKSYSPAEYVAWKESNKRQRVRQRIP